MGGFILVDGNAVAHAHHNSSKLTAGGSFQTQAIFGTVKDIRQLQFSYPTRRLIVLWDGRAQWRIDIYPEYKGNRSAVGKDGKVDLKAQAEKEHYSLQVPFLQKILQSLGIEQKLNTALEADDLAGYLTPILALKGSVLLVTGDRDWQQLIGPVVTWHDPRGEGKTVTTDNFFETTGYKTQTDFLVGKCMTGDNSDNITGVGGIGDKGAPLFVAEFGDMVSFIRLVRSGRFIPKLKKHKDLVSAAALERYVRNLKIMDLRSVPAPDRANAVPMVATYQPEVVRSIFQRLAFTSILKDFENFVRPFKPLEQA